MAGKKQVIVVGGPTASGKTGLAIELARHLDTEILSADSRQIYREMSIGTAKPSAEELARARHYFIDHRSVQQPFSVGEFEREALDVLHRLFQERDTVILAGGSGLYINALCQGLDDFPEVPDQVREEVQALYRREGLPGLQRALQALDPPYAATVDLDNPHRLIRAIAVSRVAGKPFSTFLGKKKTPRPFQPIYLQLHWPREQLYERINRRVDLMVEAGLEAEARRLYPLRHLAALQTVGYQEWFDHFAGKITREEAIELIKRNSRRYAKRQLTWMRRDGFWKHFAPNAGDQILEFVQWSRQTNLALRKLPAIHPVHAFGFMQGEEIRVEIRYQLRRKQVYATLTCPPDDEKSMFWLIHELTYRVSERPVFLKTTAQLELFAEGLGFHALRPKQDFSPFFPDLTEEQGRVWVLEENRDSI